MARDPRRQLVYSTVIVLSCGVPSCENAMARYECESDVDVGLMRRRVSCGRPTLPPSASLPGRQASSHEQVSEAVLLQAFGFELAGVQKRSVQLLLSHEVNEP